MPNKALDPARVLSISLGITGARYGSAACGGLCIGPGAQSPWPAGLDVTDARGGGGSLALDPSEPAGGRPPLDDEHRGLLVEVGVHDPGDVGVEAVAVRSFGDRSGRDRLAGD